MLIHFDNICMLEIVHMRFCMMSMEKYSHSSMEGDTEYFSIWKLKYVYKYLLKKSQASVWPLASIRQKTTTKALY